MTASLPEAKRESILKRIKGPPPTEGDRGPIKTLLDNERFDEVHLLSNYPAEWGKLFLAWLGEKSKLLPVELEKPTDYAGILKVADAELAKLRTRKDWANTELCIHLSPGTPAMAAIWLLLGKTRYPAKFYETYAGQSWETKVPFDLTIDVLPEILRDPDNRLQHLAAQSPSEIAGFQSIVGDSQAIRQAVGIAKRAAVRGVAILLLGESGTGKELFARAIHDASPRREQHFVSINCAAIASNLLESELFGHVKGAFTGADRDRKGAFEQADGGTLFLDEVGDCDLAMQAKLLRALQPPDASDPCARAIRRVGDDKDRQVHVRIVAATNRNLIDAIQQGRFRDDLHHRLAVITIALPPLRDRKSDIPKIAERLLAQINEQLAIDGTGYEHKSLSAAANGFVKRHAWPGNVRQLYNVLLQAAVLTDGPTIDKSDIIAALGEVAQSAASADVLSRPLGDGFALEDLCNDIRRHYLRRAMEEARGVKTRAAELLGIEHYQTLAHQLTRLDVQGEWA